MKVTMILADMVRLAEGKLDLLGAGWTATVADPHPTAIGIIIECPWAQMDTEHEFVLELQSAESKPALAPNGEQLARFEGKFETQRPPGVILGTPQAMNIPVAVPPMEWKANTRYKWVLTIDGQTNPEWELPFSTVARPRAA